MRLPFQPFSAQDVPQYAVPRPAPGVRPASPVLPNLAANPELAMTRAVTGAIDNIVGAVSSYRKMIINDEREAEREQEKARIELERQSAEGAADWYRKNSLKIRQYEEDLRTQKITKEQANEGLNELVRNAFPPPEAGPMSPVDKRTSERIQDAVRSDYDTFMVIGAGQEQARKESELNTFQNEAVQNFNNQLMEQARIRIEDPDSAVNPSELPKFYEESIKNQKLLLVGKLRGAGYSDAVIKQQTELLETKLNGIGYTDQFEWMTQVSRLETEGRVLGISNGLLVELERFEYENIRNNPRITPTQGVVLFERKIEELYNSDNFQSLPLVEQKRIISRNKVVFEQRRNKLQQDLTSEYQSTIQGATASRLSEVLSPSDGTVYESVDQIKAAKDAIDEEHDSLYETNVYPNRQSFEKAVHDSYLELERSTAQRMLNKGMHEKLIKELDGYDEGMFPTLDEKERGAFKKSAEAGISTGNTRSTTVAKQTIEDYLSKAVATGTSIEMEFIAEQVKAGNIPEDLALGYMAEAEYIEAVRDFISKLDGLESMDDFEYQVFLEGFEPFRREERLGEDRNIYTERQVKHYNAFKKQIEAIQKERNDDPAGFAHAYLQSKGSTKSVFDPDAVNLVFQYQKRNIPKASPRFIPKQTVNEFKESWGKAGQDGLVFDGITLPSNTAVARGAMAARVNQAKIEGFFPLKEMAGETNLDPMILDLYASLYEANDFQRLKRLDDAANLKNVDDIKKSIGIPKDGVSPIDSALADDEDFKKILGLHTGNTTRQGQIRDLAEKYILNLKSQGVDYEDALRIFNEDMRSTLDGRIVNAASNENINLSMILPDEHYKNQDEGRVVEYLVDNAADIVKLMRERANLESLPPAERDEMESLISVTHAMLTNGETPFAWRDVPGGFQLVAFASTEGPTLMPVVITHEEVLRGVSQMSVKPKGKPPGAATPQEGAIIGAGYGEDFDKPPGKRTQPAPEESEGVGQTGVQVEGVDPRQSPVNLLYRAVKESNVSMSQARYGLPAISSTAPAPQEDQLPYPNLPYGLPEEQTKGYPPPEGGVSITKERIQYVVGMIEDFANENDILIDLILAMVATESSFNPKAKGKAGEVGLMQVMKESAYADIIEKQPNFKYTWEEVSDPENLEAQLMAGMTYYLILRDHYGLKDVSDLVMAYNGGPEIRNRKGTQAYKDAEVHRDKVYSNFEKHIKPHKPYLED